jgi:MurNAc alpha-1-phosphate uridylyltransferase
MQCVILAGGRGTRMQPLTDTIPKALVPVAGKPFVHHQLTWLRTQGVHDIVFCTGYRSEQLRSLVGTGQAWNLTVRYVDEGDDLRGTAGALRLALEKDALDPSFFVLYGDSYLQVSLPPIWEAFRATAEPALMVVYRNENRWEASNVLYRNGRVVDYDKPSAGQRPELVWIDYGLAVLDRELVAERVQPGAVADLADLYRDLSTEGRLAGFEVNERFYEVGSPDGLAELERFLSSDAPT